MASVAPPSGDHSKDKKSKWRLSNPFHKDANNGQNNLAPANTRDSAYGGSETTTSDTSPNPSTTAVPTISEGQAHAQGAPVETKTDSRGRVVTTTTTTVTTTTTTTEGDSLQVPAGEEVIVRRDEHTSGSADTHATHSTPVAHNEPPPVPNEPSIPVRNAMRNKSPHGGHLAAQNQYPVEAPASPSSPTHQNFSYPGRQSFNQNGRRSSLEQQHPALRQPNTGRPRPPADPTYGQPPLNDSPESPQYQRQSIPPSLQPGHSSGFAYGSGQNTAQDPSHHQSSGQAYPPRQSTAQSIRTAAAGIHGAGETLRGALNSSIARSTGGTSEEIAKHDAITQRGRQEIESGQFVKAPPPIPESTTTTEPVPEKKSRGLKNVLRKKSPARGT